MWLYIVIAAAAGFFIGLAVGISTAIKIYTRRNVQDAIGDLRIDRSIRDEPPGLYLELNRRLEEFINEPYIVLKIKYEDFLSQ